MVKNFVSLVLSVQCLKVNFRVIIFELGSTDIKNLVM